MTETTKPGVHEMPAEDYHRHPALSSSGARRLLPPSCPALFKWHQDNPEPPKAAFELGTAAHKHVLGVGPELVVIDRDRWDTNAVKAEVAEVRARGAVPLKRSAFEQVEAMAAAIREHPVASVLFDPDRGGRPEQSLFWRDAPSGVMRRARLDWLPEPRRDGRLILPDYKTTNAADLEAVQKSIYNYGYHCQGAWYLDGVEALGLADDAAFVLVFQEKTPPYLVTIAEPDAPALRIGRARNRQAIDLYLECLAAGHWPGHSSEVELVGLPVWAEIRELEEIA